MGFTKRRPGPKDRDGHGSRKATVGRAYELMEYYFRMAVTINAVPFTYDAQNRRFGVNPSSFKYALWFLVPFIGILIETTQAGCELMRAKEDDNVSRGEWALIAFIVCSWVFVSSCHYNVFRRHHEMINHMNQTIALREWFTDARLPKCKDHKIVRAHIISSCLQCFFQSMMVAAEGTKAQFLYSNVPVEYRSGLTHGLWALFAFYRVMTNFLSGYFHYFAGALHVQTCNQILKLRQQGDQDLRTNLKYYRIVQILCNRYSETYSGWFIPHITLFATENLIMGIYGTVKFWDTLETEHYMNFPLMVVMMMIFVFTFYPKNATVYETTKSERRKTLARGMARFAADEKAGLWTRALSSPMVSAMTDPDGFVGDNPGAVQMETYGGSRSLLNSRSRKRSPPGMYTGEMNLKELRCVARSCPTVGIPFGSLYKIKRSTVMNIFNFIACNTISTLLTYP